MIVGRRYKNANFWFICASHLLFAREGARDTNIDTTIQ